MTQTYSIKDFDIAIGIDVDKMSFSFSTSDRDNMIKSKRIPASHEQMYNYIRNNYAGKQVICAYEAGPTGFGLYDYLNLKKVPCVITSPLSIPKPSNRMVKTNKIDSKDIVQHLQSGKLVPIRVPEGIWRELRHLVAIRINYANDLKRSKQRIHSLLLLENLYPSLHDPEMKWSRAHIKELRTVSCNACVRQRLDSLLDDFEYSRSKLLSIHRQLKSFCINQPEIKRYLSYLYTIPGIGFVVAVTLLGKIGNPAYLRHAQELGCFCGLVPKEHSTGDRVNKGSITHLGSKTLRFLLIEAAWTAIRNDLHFQQFYNRIKARHHSNFAAKKAITAVARKLTMVIYRVLKDQRNYISYNPPVNLERKPARVYKLQA